MGQLVGRQGVSCLERDPLRASQVRRRNDVQAFREFGKIFRRGFEGEGDWSRFQWRYGEHFPTDFEKQVVAPLDLFRGARKGQASLAKPFDIHGRDSKSNGAAASMK